MRLALDVLVTGLIVSVVLSLAVVSVAAHAQDALVVTGVATQAPGPDFPGGFILGSTACLLAGLYAVSRQRQRRLPHPQPAEEALRRRAEMAGWVC